MIKKVLIIFVILILLLLIGFALFAYYKAEQLFYYPDQVDYERSPQYFKQPFEDIWITTKDSEKLHGWFIPSTQHEDPKEALGTILHYHGNAANLTAQYSGVAWLPHQGFNVIAFDYRGYGKSSGKPSFDGVFQDGVSALVFAQSFPKIDPNKLIVIGQSLGGNVAIASVGSYENAKIKAMIIDSTFYSYPQIAGDKLAGAKFLIRDQYSAYRYLTQLQHIPIFYVHGTSDQVIPYYHSEKLYEETLGMKEKLILPNVRHIEAFYLPHIQSKITSFLTENLQHIQE